LADKSDQLVLHALQRAAVCPAGLPLHAGKNPPGLFNTSAPARQAAQLCKDTHYLRILRTEQRGKTPVEIWGITDKGLEHMLDQLSPKQVLHDLVQAIEARRGQIDELAAAAREIQANLDAFRTVAEKALQASAATTSNGLAEKGTQLFSSAEKGAASPFSEAVLEHLARRQGAGALDDCPLPELFRRAQQACADLTLGGFHDGLRCLHDQQRIGLHPWTGPLADLPEPSCALLVGHMIAYYASPRR